MVQVNAWSISSLAPRHETARSDSAQRFGSSSRAPTRAFPSNATASSGVSGQQGGTGQTRLIWQANGPPVASGSRTPAVCAHPKFDSVVLRTRGLNDQVSSGPRRDQGRALDSAGLRLPGKSEHGSPHLPAPKAKGKGRVWPTEPQTPPNQTPGTLGRVKTASHMPGSSPLQPLAASSLPSGSHTPSLPTTLSQHIDHRNDRSSQVSHPNPRQPTATRSNITGPVVANQNAERYEKRYKTTVERMYRIKNMLPDLDERGQTLNSRDSALQRDYDQTVSLVKTYGQQVPSSETRRRLQQEAFADAQKEPGILNRTVTRPSQDSSSTSPPPKPPGNAGPAQNQAQLPPEAGLSQIFRALRFNPT